MHPDSYKLFVYGTLKHGMNRHHVLRNADFLGDANKHVKGILFHMTGFPALNLDEEFSYIKGEIYMLDKRDLDECDRVEGYPHLYSRNRVDLPEFGHVWTYCMTKHAINLRTNGLRYIPSGVWDGSLSYSLAWEGWGKHPSLIDAPVASPGPTGGVLKPLKNYKSYPCPTKPGFFDIICVETGEMMEGGPYQLNPQGGIVNGGTPKVRLLPKLAAAVQEAMGPRPVVPRIPAEEENNVYGVGPGVEVASKGKEMVL